jgi:hypothetical protein
VAALGAGAGDAIAVMALIDGSRKYSPAVTRTGGALSANGCAPLACCRTH